MYHIGFTFTWTSFEKIKLFDLFQEAIKKKLEIQKQKQELLNKQIKEQKVRLQIFNECT